jgi:hypothetical protein
MADLERFQKNFSHSVWGKEPRFFWFLALFSLPPSLAPFSKPVAGGKSYGGQAVTLTLTVTGTISHYDKTRVHRKTACMEP